MISRYVDIALHFWSQHVKKSHEVSMVKVVAILPLAFSDEEFVNLKKAEPQAQVKYLSKAYKMLNQSIMSRDLKVVEHVDEIKQSIKPAKETWVTFYVPIGSLKTVEKSLLVKKDSQISISHIQSFTFSGSQIDDWNFRNYTAVNRLSRKQLKEHFTYYTPDFKEPPKVIAYSELANDKKPQNP